MPSRRRDQLSALFQERLGFIIQQSDCIPENVFVTVTRAFVPEDLDRAKIWITILPRDFESSVRRDLQKQAQMFRHLLQKQLRLRKIPKLFFVLDETETRAARIEEILDKIHSNE